jgi:hypothetical protein
MAILRVKVAFCRCPSCKTSYQNLKPVGDPCLKCGALDVWEVIEEEKDVDEPRLDLPVGPELNNEIEEVCNLRGGLSGSVRHYSTNLQHAKEAAKKVLGNLPEQVERMNKPFDICQEIIKFDCQHKKR